MAKLRLLAVVTGCATVIAAIVSRLVFVPPLLLADAISFPLPLIVAAIVGGRWPWIGRALMWAGALLVSVPFVPYFIGLEFHHGPVGRAVVLVRFISAAAAALIIGLDVLLVWDEIGRRRSEGPDALEGGALASPLTAKLRWVAAVTGCGATVGGALLGLPSWFPIALIVGAATGGRWANMGRGFMWGGASLESVFILPYLVAVPFAAGPSRVLVRLLSAVLAALVTWTDVLLIADAVRNMRTSPGRRERPSPA
jgi:hypothetical protein